MKRTLAWAGLVVAAGVVWSAAASSAGAQERPYITSRTPITILSANDGVSHLRLNAQLQRDTENVTRDSITVIHLGPDHPPIVKTVYETVPNTIGGSPYMAMTGDGLYGFVTGRGAEAETEGVNGRISVIDMASAELEVVQKIPIPNPSMALAHPDGRRIIIPYAEGFRVYEMRDGRCELVRDNQVGRSPGSIDINRAGDRIIATGGGSGGGRGMHVFSYRDGEIAHMAEVGVKEGLPRFRSPFSQRFTPDGRRVLVGNGGGSGTKGTLDDLLIIDMTLEPPMVTGVVPQVGDGVESLAIHPSGRFAALGILEETRINAHLTYSHLTVVDLESETPHILYQITIEAIPEGIEFTPDGTQLYVGLTAANHIAVFDVEGKILKKHPFVIRVGHAPSSMALGPRFRR